MPWLQLTINSSRDRAETLEDVLLAVGAASVTLEDNADQPILEPALGETPLWEQVRLTGLFDADQNTETVTRHLARALGNDLPEHRWESLEDKDWEREWMKHYRAIRCGQRLWICPSWQKPPEPDKVNLMLDPGLAFGTGTHPTTFLCLQWLDGQNLTDQALVDYGCGSGILGIAALLLGAHRVLGVDIDPQALTATRDNAQRNQVAPEAMPVYLPENCPETRADTLLANILAGPLVKLAPRLQQMIRPGGQICLSGILANQAETVMAAYRPWFDFDPLAEQDNWVRLTATKRQ
mgnify:FL=1